MHRVLIAVPLVVVALAAGCSNSSSRTNQQVRDLQATVAALSARTPQVVTVTPIPDTATPSPSPTPTESPTPIPPTPAPTPETYQLSGSISAPKCDGGYNLTNASVTVRDEHTTVIGSTTTSDNVVPYPTPIPAEEKSEIDRYTKQKSDRDTAQLFDQSGRLRPVPIVLPLPVAVSEAATRDNDAYQKALTNYLSICSATFSTSLPRAGFYQITIGSHGGPSYSFDQMQGMGWKLDLSLK